MLSHDHSDYTGRKRHAMSSVSGPGDRCAALRGFTLNSRGERTSLNPSCRLFHGQLRVIEFITANSRNIPQPCRLVLQAFDQRADNHRSEQVEVAMKHAACYTLTRSGKAACASVRRLVSEHVKGGGNEILRG